VILLWQQSYLVCRKFFVPGKPTLTLFCMAGYETGGARKRKDTGMATPEEAVNELGSQGNASETPLVVFPVQSSRLDVRGTLTLIA
jgi:hypothetical protein